MRRTKNMILLTALATLCLTAMAFAQMSPTREKAQMTTQMAPDSARAMMMKMSENYQAMDQSLKQLEDHMKSMMKMDNMDELRSEMEKHVEMMRSMDKMMGEQHRMAWTMMGRSRMSHMEQMELMKGKTMETKKIEEPPKEKKN